MKGLFQKLLLVLLFASQALKGFTQKEEVCYNPNLIKDTTKKSIKSMAVGTIGGDSLTIRYHSPGVRKRIIWGGLVPYDEVWVTGAHDATVIETKKPYRLAGTIIPAGRYAFFTIPGKDQWTIIINKNWQQHLAGEYDQKDDIVRLKVKPKKVTHTERLQYFVEDLKNGSGKIAVAWEKIRIEVPITFKTIPVK